MIEMVQFFYRFFSSSATVDTRATNMHSCILALNLSESSCYHRMAAISLDIKDRTMSCRLSVLL